MMTKKQKRKFESILQKDIEVLLSSPGTFTGLAKVPVLPVQTNNILTINEALDRIERLQKEKIETEGEMSLRQIEKIFSREQLFRFSYVPFVIAELVWDYADTVMICAQRIGNPATRRLSREIRNARTEYERLRQRHIDADNREREIENGYVFEDGVHDITSQMLVNIQCDIRSAYPDLNDDSRDLLIATYQCHVTSAALLKYIEKQRREVARRLNRNVGNILPPSYMVMHRLIPEYIGDKPATPRFRDLMNKYIDTFAVQIALVELNDKTEND